ncbi:MAG: hypothetical protein KAJ40_02725 [Alphaproteobacteria bacterium]|nr:hypothetical protein [Alphaproteobacteria bacterium]
MSSGLAGAFNALNKATGYGKSPGADASSLDSFVKSDPMFEKRPTVIQSLMKVDTSKQTLMSKLHPETKNTVSSITGGMKRTPDLALKDGQDVSRNASVGMEAAKNKRNEIKTNVEGDKVAATNAVKDTANNMDIDPSQAEKDLVGTPSSDIGTLAAGAALLVTGGGSLAVQAGITVWALLDVISKEQKKLSPQKQEALLQKTVERAQSSGQASPIGEAVRGGSKVASNLGNLNAKEFKELLNVKIENLPEMKDAENQIAALEDVEGNHDSVKRHFGDKITLEKMAVAGIAEPKEPFDHINASLTGDSVAGVLAVNVTKGFTSDVPEDLKSKPVSEDFKLPPPELAQRVNASLGTMNA